MVHAHVTFAKKMKIKLNINKNMGGSLGKSDFLIKVNKPLR